VANVPVVLVVDDDRETAEVVCHVLSRDGHVCVSASDGRGAWEVFRARAVGVVVVDVDLPDVSGVQLLREFKRTRPDVPVMVMTGNPSTQLLFDACEAGADRYLTKPLDLQAVRGLVRKVRESPSGERMSVSNVAARRSSVLIRWSRWIVGR
jgi:DNA-binding response OmpR family regulator